MKYYNCLPIAANYLIAKGLLIAALSAFSLSSFAQNTFEQNTSTLFDTNFILELLDDGVDESAVNEEIEDLLEHYQKLRKHPLNINSATKGDLKRLRVLSDFQIFALLEHISSTGAILSQAELELVYGFTPQTVAFLSPFIYFGEAAPSKKGFFKDAQSTLYSKYYFDNDYFLLKYNMQYLNKLEVEYIISAGDFMSGSIALYNKRLGKLDIQSIILGDMRVSFGQGLTLCNSTSFGAASASNGFMKNREPLGIYTSANEENYLRGMGATISYKRLTVTPLISYRGIDAALTSSQNSMNELVSGVNISMAFNRFKFGLSYCGYSYTRVCSIEPKYYNQNRLYNGFHWNLGADFYTILYGVRIFGEVAYSLPGALAALLGANYTIGNSNIYLLARYYPANYIAPHAGAYSTISYVANQQGFTLAADGRIWRKFYYGINASFTYYPYYRYNIKCSSSNVKFSVKVGWSDKDFLAAARNEISCTFAYRNTTKYFTSGEDVTALWSLRWFGKLSFCKWANITSRGEYNSEGSLGASCFLNVATNNQKFRAHLGATWYNAPIWNGRIYLYEQDLPQTFSSSMLYGNGLNLSAIISCRLARFLSIHFKLSHKTTARTKTTSQTLALRLGLQLFF